MLKYLMLLVVSMALASCGFIKGSSNPIVDKGIKFADKVIPEDSDPEEALEDMIEGATGIILDFSPRSIEKE